MRSYPPVYQSAPLPSISIAASWPASCVESAREPACDKSVSPTPRGGAGPQHVGQLAADLLAGAHRQRTDSTLRRLTLRPCRERPRGRGTGSGSPRFLSCRRFDLLLPCVLPAQPAPTHGAKSRSLRIVAARLSVLGLRLMSGGGRIAVHTVGTLGTPSSSGRQFGDFGLVDNA